MNLKEVNKQFDELEAMFVASANRDKTLTLLVSMLGARKIMTSQSGIMHVYTIESLNGVYDIKAVVSSSKSFPQVEYPKTK